MHIDSLLAGQPVASDALLSQPPSSSTKSCACAVCNSAIHCKFCSVTCAGCIKNVHMTCLVNQYKQSGGAIHKLKNTQEWLKNVLLFYGLQFTCTMCRVAVSRPLASADGNFLTSSNNNKIGVFPSLQPCFSKVKSIVEHAQYDLLQLINDMYANGAENEQAEIRNICSDSNTSGSSTVSRVAVSMLYAAAASANLSETVKSAVAYMLKSQTKVEHDNSSLVI